MFRLDSSNESNEMLVAIVAGTLLFLLFSIFIIIYLVIYWRRKVRHRHEVETIQSIYRQEILKTKLEIQEQTLNYISGELHDNVGQILSLAKLQTHLLQQKGGGDEELLQALSNNIHTAMDDLRSLAKSLNSQWVQATSVERRIIEEIQRLEKINLLQFNIQVEGQEHPLDKQRTLICFRIFQESLQNILKHAQATTVDIQISYLSDCMELRIRDNGIGFSSGQTDPGLGLDTMKQRAALLNGTLQIKSQSGEGTLIFLSIPYG